MGAATAAGAGDVPSAHSPLIDPDPLDRRLQDEREHQLRARRLILPVLLLGYLVLLALNILLPFMIVPTLEDSADVGSIRDLMLAISSALQGLVGLVAIAVGYYFRLSQEK